MPDTTALWVAKMASPLPPVATNDGTLLSLAPPQGAQPLAELLRLADGWARGGSVRKSSYAAPLIRCRRQSVERTKGQQITMSLVDGG
jgi:hypothetical protein